MNLSVVLPAYNEAESLALLLPTLIRELDGFETSFEILVVDTAEPMDHTPAICTQFGVRHIPRRGGASYGDAVRTGISDAAGRYILFMDADGSHNPKQLVDLWAKRDQAGLVIGSRYVPGGTTENPQVLVWMSYAVNFVFRMVFRLQCHDVTNSLRLYHAAPLKQLRLSSNNFDILEEILIRLITGPNRISVIEVPITFEQRKAGHSKRSLFAFMLTYFSTLVRLMKFRREAQSRVGSS